MQEHTLFQIAMPRDHARRVAKELGYKTGATPRGWKRPAAGPDNLFTGYFSPLKPGRDQLLAHDRVNSESADILLFSLFADVAQQRATLRPDTLAAVVCALANGFRQAINALLTSQSAEQIEAALYVAGGTIVRAILFVIGRGEVSTPLRAASVKRRRWWIFRRLRSV